MLFIIRPTSGSNKPSYLWLYKENLCIYLQSFYGKIRDKILFIYIYTLLI